MEVDDLALQLTMRLGEMVADPGGFGDQIGHPKKIQNTNTFQLQTLGNNPPGLLVFFWIRSQDSELEFGQHPDAAIRCVPRSPTSACETCATWLMRHGTTSCD